MDGNLVPRKVLRFLGSITGAAVLISLFTGGSLLWTTYLWYTSMGAAAVLTTRLASQGVTWLVATGLATLVLYTAVRLAGTTVHRGKRFNSMAFAFSLFLAAITSWHLAGNWMTFRLAVTQSPFGVLDPQFGKDVGFFVFTLPAFELLNAWFNGLIVLSAILVAGVVFIPEFTGMERVVADKWQRVQSLGMALFGFMMVSSALGRLIGVYRLEYQWHPQLVGASYTDLHAVLPAQWIMAAMSTLVAVVVFATARSRRWKPQLLAVVSWVLVAIAVGGIWPAVLQSYVVSPNEAKLERPYIERNIRMTRTAFALNQTTGQEFPAAESLDASTSAATSAALKKVRLWTPFTVAQAYAQLQTIRPYYKLSSIETDRYEVNGSTHMALVAARQIDASALPKRAKTWVNQHLVYTHGYGLAIASASETTLRGFPRFLVGDVPPTVASDVATGSPDLRTDEPRIYYGTDVSDYAIINTGIDEFDYPNGEHNETYRNTSGQGVQVGSGLRRLAWAVKLGANQVLFSRYVNADSRVLINRDVVGRAKRLAPWLQYADSPYAALVDGRIVWILDGFTSSDHYPYSQPLDDGRNYLRGSVKVTIDAFSGETTLYAVGDDQIRDAWAKIFPGLIRPEAEISPSLAEHFRYPQELLAAQALIYRTYHMTDPNVFYNKEDQWQIAKDQDGDPAQPSYVTLQLPGTPAPGLYLMQPFNPLGRDNLVGWMAAGCDPNDYGRQTVYLLPKDRVVLGPRQIAARINQDPVISPQLSLWNQRGSKVIFGDMAVMPVEGSVTYVQPIFLRAETTAITELAGVVVVNGDRVQMARTLSGALAATFGTSASADADDRVIELLGEAVRAKDRGDIATYRDRLQELEQMLSSASSAEESVTP